MPHFPLMKVSYTRRKSAYQVLAALPWWGMGVLICTEKPKLHESPSEAHLLLPSHSGSQSPRCHFPPMCLLGNLVPGARSGPASVAFRVGGGCGAWPAFALPPILGKAAGGALRDGCESAHRNVEDALFPAHQRTNVLGPGRGGPDITVWLHRSHVRPDRGHQPGAGASEVPAGPAPRDTSLYPIPKWCRQLKSPYESPGSHPLPSILACISVILPVAQRR